MARVGLDVRRSFGDSFDALTEPIRGLDVPTLLIFGENDPLVSVSTGHRFAELIPGARLLVLPGCGDFPQEERPKDVGEAIHAFLGTDAATACDTADWLIPRPFAAALKPPSSTTATTATTARSWPVVTVMNLSHRSGAVACWTHHAGLASIASGPQHAGQDDERTTEVTDQRTQIGWLPGFILLSAIWGSSFALIKVAVDADVPPMWVALWRCLFGALTLGVMFVATGQRLPRSAATWGNVVVVAALLNSVPFVLLAWGETQVSSLLAGIFNATTPLTTLLFVFALVPGEHPGPRRLLGLALGFVGVLVVLGIWHGLHGLHGGTRTGGLACIGATACYGAGFAYTRRFLAGGGESAITLSAMQIGCATVELALVCPLASGAPHWPGAEAGLALLVLGAVGTGVAYLLNFSVIRAAGATVASTVTYLVPLWSTALGAVALSEPVSPGAIVGGVMIIGGAALTRPPRPRPRPAPASTGATGKTATGDASTGDAPDRTRGRSHRRGRTANTRVTEAHTDPSDHGMRAMAFPHCRRTDQPSDAHNVDETTDPQTTTSTSTDPHPTGRTGQRRSPKRKAW